MSRFSDEYVGGSQSHSKGCKELYQFGINRILLFTINIATSVMVGAILGMIWQSIIFPLAYIPLRQYAGGYHALTPRLCYGLSTLLIAVSLFLIRCEMSLRFVILGTFICAAVVWVKVPVESKNKKLSEAEHRAFRKTARRIVIFESALIFVLEFSAYDSAAQCVLIAIMMTSVLLFFPDTINKE
ncbi:hypothetical protein D3Z38_17885 [Clostridiales bacterium]|nr:hypothetical protein [Clostridiales bacterium]